jgi:hypothetical protein
MSGFEVALGSDLFFIGALCTTAYVGYRYFSGTDDEHKKSPIPLNDPAARQMDKHEVPRLLDSSTSAEYDKKKVNFIDQVDADHELADATGLKKWRITFVDSSYCFVHSFKKPTVSQTGTLLLAKI